MEKIFVFKEVLSNINDYDWGDWVYLDESEERDLNCRCAVLNLDDLEPEEDEPDFAIDNGLECFLSVHQIQDVVENYNDGNDNPTLEGLFEAIMYYYENDGFINV